MSTKREVVRWYCDHCARKSYSRRSMADAHEGLCHRNPANRTCSTCVHFTRTPCCATASDDCGCKGLNDCAVGAFETWRYNDHETRAPVPDGWWTAVVDWQRDCPQWAEGTETP